MKKKLIILGIILIVITISTIIIVPTIYNKIQNDDIIVLAYHHFMDEDEKNKYESENGFVISTKNFEEQLKLLKKKGYKTMTSEDLYCYIKEECKLKGKHVLITMDDGNISSYYKALPILEKYEYNSINFVIASRVKEKSEEWGKFDKYYFLGKDLINDIKDNHPLMEIGAHSYNLHSKIDGVSPLKILSREELVEDSKKAKEILNTDVYCFPFGAYNENLTKALEKAEFKMSFTFNPPGYVNKDNNIYAIPRVEVRGDYSIEKFERVLSNKKTITEYWKEIIKKIIGRA